MDVIKIDTAFKTYSYIITILNSLIPLDVDLLEERNSINVEIPYCILLLDEDIAEILVAMFENVSNMVPCIMVSKNPIT